ncbi:MAG: RHS repeat-associated core domain-containing protein [Pseudodesulfovibrio sp.]
MQVYDCRLRRDPSGRITGKTETVAGRAAVWEYAYDQAGRLTGAKLDGRTICDIGYDREGRRSRDYFPHLDTRYRAFTYSVMDNRLQRAGNNGYTHDKNGFRSIWNHGGQYTLYEYGPDYRLLKAEKRETGEVFEFTHDDQGCRAVKSCNGRPVEAYRWLDLLRLGGYHDGESGYRFAYRGGERTPYAMQRENGEAAYLFYDQVGSLRVVADSDGNVIKEVLYDPFGGIIENSNPGLCIPIGFAGGLHDRDLGFVRFGWRDYDTFTSRWTAPDPLGDKGGDPDWYGYCLDDPVNGEDPLGLAARKYAGADSEAGKFFGIGEMQYDNRKQQLEIFDEDQLPRKRERATSGLPGVSDSTLKDRGPIPPGSYEIAPREVTKTKWYTPGDWGEYRVPLHPTPNTNLHGRSGFFLHGGEKEGSRGCIDLGTKDSDILPLIQKQNKKINLKVK